MRKNGFSLIELVMVLVIMGILAVMSSKLLLEGGISETTGQDINTPDWQGSFALSRMTDEIHSIVSSGNITTAGANQIVFTDATNTSITYSLSSGNLLENSNTLAANVSSLTFAYYDRNGTVTGTINNIRYVQVTLNLAKSGYTYSYTTSIFLPNLP